MDTVPKLIQSVRKGRVCPFCGKWITPGESAMAWTVFKPFAYKLAHKACYDKHCAGEAVGKVAQVVAAASTEIAANPQATVMDLLRALSSRQMPPVAAPEPEEVRGEIVGEKVSKGEGIQDAPIGDAENTAENLKKFDPSKMPANYRYWKSLRTGKLYCYSTKRDTNGYYWTWIKSPKGKGARTGQAKKYKLWQKPVGFKVRSKAKARARLRWNKDQGALPKKKKQELGDTP